MTFEQLKSLLERAAAIGSGLAPIIPGEWDDVIAEGLQAVADSDPLLKFVAKTFLGDDTGPFGATPQQIEFGAAHGFGPAEIALILAIIRFIRDLRRK